MLLLVLALLAQAPCGPAGPIICATQRSPLFEFAPVTGSGMGAACACAAPTGSRGEALTFTRASSGTCLKGNTTSGIANGDLVTCSSNEARVMPGGDGTGGNGLLVEGARTNDLLRSQEAENASWAVQGTVTRTANAAVAPDGTTTADRLQIAAGNANAISQLVTGAATISTSLFIKGNATSGTIDLGVFTAGAGYVCVPCSYVAATWTRCAYENASRHATTGTTVIGNWNTNGTNCTSSSAKDIFVWGMQQEVGAFASSYIATAGAAATRATELGKFVGSWAAGAGFSLFATVNVVAVKDGDPFFAEASVDTTANDRIDLYRVGNTTLNALCVAGGAACSGPNNATLVAGATQRVGAYYDGTSTYTCVDGACSGTARSFTPWATTAITVGNFSNGGDPAWAVVKRVCFDNTATRCR